MAAFFVIFAGTVLLYVPFPDLSFWARIALGVGIGLICLGVKHQ